MPCPRPILLFLAGALLFFAPNRSGAIIDGTDASITEFPWIAAIIQKGNFGSPALIGGGSLVGDQWILTAAHSVVSLSAGSIEVWLGSDNLEDPTNRQVRNVLAIYRHPDFVTDTGTSTNDLALLLLDRPVAGIPILPYLSDPFGIAEGDPVAVAGWGTSTVGLAEATNQLQKASAEIISEATAQMTFGPVVTGVHLPATDPDEIATPCVGDSGSPLIKTILGDDVLVGLVSFGSADCDNASLPTIYTRIPVFAAWLDENLTLTAEPSALKLSGNDKTIQNGDASRTKNLTDFGKLRRPGSSRTRRFVVQNQGDGLLTVRSTSLPGKAFSVRQSNAKIINAGASSALRIRFKAPSKGKTHRSTVKLLTNDPANPVFRFRLEARVR
jgi:secreted trypsin-like serine protease